MGKINLTAIQRPVPFRKIAMGTWDTPMDPTVYGLIDLDMKPVLDHLKLLQERDSIKLSPMHLVAKALAICIKARPEINGMIRFKKVYFREKTRVFFQVNVPGGGEDKTKGANLVGVCLDDMESMSLKEIAEVLRQKSEVVRAGKDKELNKGMALVKILPWWAIKFYLNISSFLIYNLNLDLSFLGFPKDPFGSAMITNVGSLGIDCALAPLCAYTKSPLLLTLGAIQEKPWNVKGEVAVRPVISIGVTFDHRLIDGVHAAKMAQQFKEIMAKPEAYL